ncbi:MAG: hypothetical protein AAF442_00130 [Pseudomonadota bacterium]
MTMTTYKIEGLLTRRAQTHGHYPDIAEVAQGLKSTIRESWQGNHDPELLEAVDMICHKLARITVGDEAHRDHWDDIAGYALLAAKRCGRDGED